ncbi:MAG: FAD-dependent oxidoreductase [Chromatiales bacterium]|nr:FAD-dependent oxidoreductase [Chromatiales bacterium]
MSTQDVVIIGAGAAGLTAALELAGAGLRVAVVERGAAARESSWAGGGIVAPLYPWRYPRAVQALALEGHRLWPQWTARLEAQTGVAIEYTASGMWIGALGDVEPARAWAGEHGLDCRPLDVDAVARETGVHLTGPALAFPDFAQLRTPRLGRALALAAVAAGVELITDRAATAIETVAGRVAGVRLADGTALGAPNVVVAAGAWSAGLLAPLGLDLPVAPVRGQMLLYSGAAGRLAPMVLSEGRYLIPRRDGRVLCGSTMEDVGFEKATTDEAAQSLRAAAVGMAPWLADCPIEAHWAGLRPGSPDGVPFIGAVAEVPGLYLNCGHHRNGIVLAPGSARLLRALLSAGEPEIDPLPYRPVLAGGEVVQSRS